MKLKSIFDWEVWAIVGKNNKGIFDWLNDPRSVGDGTNISPTATF